MLTPKQREKVEENLDKLIEIKSMKPFTKRVLQFIEIFKEIQNIEMKFMLPGLNKKERDNLLYEYMALVGNLNNMLPDYKYGSKREE
jgi:hypothetical protein